MKEQRAKNGVERIGRRELLRWVALTTVAGAGSTLLNACGGEEPAATVRGASGVTAPPAPAGAAAPPAALKGDLQASVWGMPWEDDLYTKIYFPAFKQQNTGIGKVELLSTGPDSNKYLDRIVQLQAGGQLPDTIRLSLSFAPQLVTGGFLRPLDDYLTKGNFNRADIPDSLWEPVRKDGKTYGIPQDLNVRGLYYNKTLLDGAGVKYPTHEYTLEQLEQDAQKLTKREAGGQVSQYGFGVTWTASSSLIWLIYANGGKVWDDAKTKVTLTSPEAVKSLEWLRRMALDLKAMPVPADLGGVGQEEFFKQGKIAMYSDGTHRAPDLQKNAPMMQWAATSSPKGTVKKTTAGSQSFGVSAMTKNPDAAYALADYVTNTESLIKYWQVLWVAPPSRASSLNSPAYKQITGLEGLIAKVNSEAEFADKLGWITYSAEQKLAVTEYNSPYYATFNREIVAAMEKVVAVGSAMKPADALKVAEDNINAYIAQKR